MHCLPQRLKLTFFEMLKSTFFEIFLNGAGPFEAAPCKIFSKNVDLILAFQKGLILAFEANSALSCENETKNAKIMHSVEDGCVLDLLHDVVLYGHQRPRPLQC